MEVHILLSGQVNQNYFKKDMVWATLCIIGMPSCLTFEWIVIVINNRER